jgi:hypothetical protein
MLNPWASAYVVTITDCQVLACSPGCHSHRGWPVPLVYIRQSWSLWTVLSAFVFKCFTLASLALSKRPGHHTLPQSSTVAWSQKVGQSPESLPTASTLTSLAWPHCHTCQPLNYTRAASFPPSKTFPAKFQYPSCGQLRHLSFWVSQLIQV